MHFNAARDEMIEIKAFWRETSRGFIDRMQREEFSNPRDIRTRARRGENPGYLPASQMTCLLTSSRYLTDLLEERAE